MVAIVSNNREFIFKAVADMYTDVAQHPLKGFHFPTGRLACLFVGYPAAQLDRIPGTATESFAGVGYPFAADVIREGDTVLDIGSGSGTDSLITSLLVGGGGKVYGLDMTAAMLEKIRRNIEAMGALNVEPVSGNAEEIPLPDASVDVVTSNGVLNLVPDKPRAFREIVRVLKPGGRVQISDISLAKPVSERHARTRSCGRNAWSGRSWKTTISACSAPPASRSKRSAASTIFPAARAPIRAARRTASARTR